MNDKNLIAVITVRKGSQRVKNKNFKKFASKNLLIHKIEILKTIKGIDEIIVNTDSTKAINIAKKLNVGFFKRQSYYASSSCPNSKFWSNVAKNTKSNYIMFTHCTNPLVTKKTYNKFLEIFKNHKDNYDSFNSVSEVKEFLIKDNKPINFNLSKAPNSQDLPNIIKLNFAISILSTKLMYKKKSLVGNKPYFIKLDPVEGFDINTELEFKFAEYLFQQRNK
jgi:CMP-N,N'-diacetyllegionaminic acid synthase